MRQAPIEVGLSWSNPPSTKTSEHVIPIHKIGAVSLIFLTSVYPVHQLQKTNAPCYTVKTSPASLRVWSAELEGLIDISLGVDIKYCAPPLASKTHSHLVIDISLGVDIKYCAPPLASKMYSHLVIDFSLKGWDLVLCTACGVQNAFAFSDKFQTEVCYLVLRTACGVQNAFAFCRTG